MRLTAGAAVEAALVEAAPAPRPAYFTYTVQNGDSVAGIAAAFGIDPVYILWNNADLSFDPDLLQVGEELIIPGADGLIYTVKLGDTISDIADFYGIDVESILSFTPNSLSSADNITEGLLLVLPGAVPPPPPPAPAVVANPAQAPSSPGQVSASGFIWPWPGPITSYFGEPRGGGFYHDAIDIDGYGRYGAPVVAAASGTVVVSSWLDWGLGYHVIIRHADGSETVYAHFSNIYVSVGQVVSQGETIGAIGCTGYCTGSHLHFEIHIGGVAVNPLTYLP